MKNSRNEQDIAAIVRTHRKKAGLSQEALAKMAGVGKSAVFDIEKGKESVQLDTLRKVLEVLNITMRFESPIIRDAERDARK